MFRGWGGGGGGGGAADVREGLGGIPMEGMIVEKDRSGFLTHQCAYCQYSNLPAHLYRLIQSFLFTF